MQSESPENLPDTSTLSASDFANSTHHGYHDDRFSPALPSPEALPSADGESGSEWSASPPCSLVSSEESQAWLSLIPNHTSDVHDTESSSTKIQQSTDRLAAIPKKLSNGRLLLQGFPEELLLHVMSHLPATDLLTLKLVSRAFHDLVKSPHAWMNAFSQYFPGSVALKSTAEIIMSQNGIVEWASEKRAFTRLVGVPSWTGEYLLRTKLLRCLTRGKPALPFASPSPGHPDKGMATFTYSSRLQISVSHLHATFGQVLDKRHPKFVHGFSENGTVSSSDKKAKFDNWGLLDRIFFKHFSERHPGREQWGLGVDRAVGVPNVMDLSQPYGMVYGEGTPDGNVFFLPCEQRRGMYLAPLVDLSLPNSGVPRISPNIYSICSVWIAKSSAVPRMTRGLVGLFSGSSSGIVSAYSVGSVDNRGEHFPSGVLTARWMLSPGVPIIALVADDAYNEVRFKQRRVWAVALNALGEIFYLCDVPQQAVLTDYGEENAERNRELRAWQTGNAVVWRVIKASKRCVRQHEKHELDDDHFPSYIPKASSQGLQVGQADMPSEVMKMESWLLKSPAEMRVEFLGWDMRRRFEVDFAGDDGHEAGETVMVITCGVTEGQPTNINRYSRFKPSSGIWAQHSSVSGGGPPHPTSTVLRDQMDTRPPSLFGIHSWTDTINKASTVGSSSSAASTTSHLKSVESLDEWRCSRLTFGRYKNVEITVTAMDMSMYATTTSTEDTDIRLMRGTGGRPLDKLSVVQNMADYSPFKIPGQRARLVAAGTAAGTIFVWNARAPASKTSSFTNTVKPVRIIHTDSPQISSLALSALYLVHGGSEGLVQAWDVLASTLDPIRTLSSRSTLNRRRRAVIAAQQNLNAQNARTNIYAAGAICLDPDPANLRGIVAIGNYLRYWSYSSASASEEQARSQKRKSKRAARASNYGGGGDGTLSTRRSNLKSFVDDELHDRTLEKKEQSMEARDYRRLDRRFGLELLGQDATEEEVVAYAKMVSAEEHDLRQAKQLEERLSRDATEEEVEAHMRGLSDGDFEKWKFASWEERFRMPASTHGTVDKTSAVGLPAGRRDSVDEAVAQAIKLSLGEVPSSPHTVAGPSSIPPEEDNDIAEAIRQSLDSTNEASGARGAFSHSEEDLAEAIALSIADNSSAISTAKEDFPALTAPAIRSPQAVSASRKVQGKRKARA